MASLDFEFTTNSKEIKKQINKVRQNIKKSPGKLLTSIGKQEVKNARYRVRTSKRDPDNRTWAEWSYATIKSRANEGKSAGGPLYKSGLLYRRFKSYVKKTTVTITNSAFYAKYLQYGRDTPTRMPKREFLGWGKDSNKQITTLVKKWFKGIIK